MGSTAFLCALLLCACNNSPTSSGPSPKTEGEAQAIADAQSMLSLREPPASQSASALQENAAR